jgi:hypothetical protein
MALQRPLANKSFYVHHCSWGSYSSFILGKLFQGGGFVLGNVNPPATNVYIGYARQGGKPRLLPFVAKKMSETGEERYTGNSFNPRGKWYQENVNFFGEDEIERRLDWAADTWAAGDIVFKLITPFFNIPSLDVLPIDSIGFYTAPLILAELEFDNTEHDTEMTGLFALESMRRPLSDLKDNLIGTAAGTSCGFGLQKQSGAAEILAWDACKSAFTKDSQALTRLGFEGGLRFTIPPKTRKKYEIVLATYRGGSVTSNIKTRFLYTDHFADLEEVIGYGLVHYAKYREAGEEKNAELNRALLNDHRKFMIAHATHSYMANTELLADERGRARFIVNEGEYQMMNTLDLTVDQVFWELQTTPWTIRNVLDFHAARYGYRDWVQRDNGTPVEAGIGFCHDEGVSDMFAPEGNSSYELSGISGCFSFMTFEQILNWILSAGVYAITQNDS